MEIGSVDFILLSLVFGLTGHWAYKEGIREGANRTINILHQKKVIAYDNEGEIYPNPFFKKK